MSQQPYQITAPAVMTMKANASGTFEVVNSGTKPIVVHESLGRYTDKALQYPAADHATTTTMNHPWLHLDGPAAFTLQPGHARTVHVTSHVPAGAQGNHFLNILWTASPVHAQGGPVHLAGAVATNVEIPLAGVAQPVTSTTVPKAPLAPHHGGLPAADLAGGGLGALVVLAAAVTVMRRRRNRRRAQEVTA